MYFEPLHSAIYVKQRILAMAAGIKEGAAAEHFRRGKLESELIYRPSSDVGVEGLPNFPISSLFHRQNFCFDKKLF